jgi:metallophosphoesterase superfamily enzyme
LAGNSYRAFLQDEQRVILPAYGAYTGGLWTTDPALQALMGPKSKAILLARKVMVIPMPRQP